MTLPASWRKASFSSNNPNCVELAGTLDRVRDSKHPQVTLDLSREAVAALVRAVR